MRPAQGFRGKGKRGINFKGTGELRQYFERNRGTKTILGNRENNKKQFFRFFVNRATRQFISEKQGIYYPPWRVSLKIELVTSIRYKLAYAFSEDLNQSAHLHSLVSFPFKESLNP